MSRRRLKRKNTTMVFINIYGLPCPQRYSYLNQTKNTFRIRFLYIYIYTVTLVPDLTKFFLVIRFPLTPAV